MTTTVLERFEALRRLSEQHNYSAALTPVQFADCYLHLAIPLEDHLVFTPIHRYRINLPPTARQEKNGLLHALKREWRQGNLLSARGWAAGRGGEGRIIRAFNGKAMPEEMILTCQLAVLTGYRAPDTVGQWASTHFGLDCSGFVNNYFIATGRIREHRTIAAHAVPASRRITRRDEIARGSLLIWAQPSGAILSNPGHIAIVDHWLDRTGDRLTVVESSGSFNGLHTGGYRILKDPGQTGRSALWRVQRPNGTTSHVYFVPPPA